MRAIPVTCSLVALCIATAGALAASPAAARQERQSPHAIAPIVAHDFGSVEQGSKIVHPFTIQNPGTAPLMLGRLSLSEPGMTARMRPSIPAGEQASLTIEWDTSGAKGAVEGRAVLETDDPTRPQLTFVLTGVVKQAIEFVPYQAVFASGYQGEAVRRRVRIVNNRERPLAIARLEQDGPHFQAAIRPVEAGKLYDLEVTVPATVPAGRYAETVFVYTDDPKMPRLMVPVNLLVKPGVYANPGTVDFGRVNASTLASDAAISDPVPETVIVRKRSGLFSITSVTSDIPFVSIRRSPDGTASSEAFRIDVALVKGRVQPGPIRGSVRIRTDDKEFPELILYVRGEIQ